MERWKGEGGLEQGTGVYFFRLFLGAFLRARKNRAFHSNSSALPAVKPPVFPFQSLARANFVC
ncbi:MAG: hypothetical protein LBG07_05620, partial [Treponema sp.]|nr:hypothetical protein [Treponema sp.]